MHWEIPRAIRQRYPRVIRSSVATRAGERDTKKPPPFVGVCLGGARPSCVSPHATEIKNGYSPDQYQVVWRAGNAVLALADICVQQGTDRHGRQMTSSKPTRHPRRDATIAWMSRTRQRAPSPRDLQPGKTHPTAGRTACKECLEWKKLHVAPACPGW